MRLAVLDLFIRNTDAGQQYPNIAHYLLFGDTLNEQQIQDPHALGARRTCIHSILDLVNTGVPRINGKGRGHRHVSVTTPLFMTNPALAAQCYRVIYQLCVHPRTSDFTMRYLRTRENLFPRQLAAIPSRMPETSHGLYIEVTYSDASRVRTTASAFSSFPRLRSYTFDLAALDLHVLTNKAHHKGAIKLLEILFGNATEQQNEFDDYSFQEVGQSYIIKFVQSLSFDWSDSLTVRPVDMEFLGQLNLKFCMRTNDAGRDVMDRTVLLSLLTATKRTLHFQGCVITSTQAEYSMQLQVVMRRGEDCWTQLFQHLPHSR
jgi:nuclear pore complex protein Nup205